MQEYSFNNSQYSKKIHKPKRFVFTILISLIIILTFIFSYIKTNNQTINFYFIQVEKFSNYQDALNYKLKIEKIENTILYIYFDDYYFLLQSFHNNNKKAKQELKKSSHKNTAEILSISTKKFRTKKHLNNNQNLYLKNLFKTLANLNKLSSETTTQPYEKILEKIKSYKSEIENNINNFYKTFKIKTKLNKVIKNLDKIKKFLEIILNSNNENFIKIFQFYFINIVMQEIEIYNLF